MQVLEFDIFTNVASGQALSVGDPQPYLHQADFDQSDVRQYWLRTRLQTNRRPGVAPGLILSRTFSYAIDVVNNGFQDGGTLQQYPPNANANQIWNDRSLGLPNRARIIECTDPTAARTFAIDIPDGEPNRDPQIWHSHEGPNQQWIPAPQLNLFTVFKVQSVVSGKVLDVPGGAQAPGATIQQFHDGGEMCFNQWWRLLTSPDNHEVDDPNLLVDGLLVRIQSLCNGLFLKPQSTAGGQSWVIQEADSGNDDQVWQLVGNNAGFKVQPRLNASVVLDLQNGSADDGVLMQVYPGNGGMNQRWVFV